jgi:glycosyltransferase involved in cell wall biosynthesis
MFRKTEQNKSMRIAAFGFRSIPPQPGCAGADKFAMELFPRLVKAGHQVIAYNRLYSGQTKGISKYQGVNLIYLRTISKTGFDTIFHSLISCVHILLFNTGDIIHIQNGGNSIWALFLRIFGKKVFISQDGVDWKRDKWPWYGKLFLSISKYMTAYLPNKVIFDNIFSWKAFEEKFRKKFNFIPFGSEVKISSQDSGILKRLNLEPKEYFLFVGRFIPDKGVHYLISAFKKISTTKKLVLVGGSPNPSNYEKAIMSTEDKRIIFPGYIYGDDTVSLIKHAYAYIQPSDIEGLSPVLLSVMYLGTPVICSDIEENVYIVGDNAFTFNKSDVMDLMKTIELSLSTYESMLEKANRAQIRIQRDFSWDAVTEQHINLFQEEYNKGGYYDKE